MGYIDMKGKLYRIVSRRKVEIQPNNRVKRTGAKYFELAYWTGSAWTYIDFETRDAANKFLTMKGIK